MDFIKRIFGICETKQPGDPGCWKYSNRRVEIEWARVPELQKPSGAIRLEGRGLPERILVIFGIDGQFHVFRNRCSYDGRRLDPVPGTTTVRCCALSQSTFDYTGKAISGPAKESLRTYKIKSKKCKIIIQLN